MEKIEEYSCHIWGIINHNEIHGINPDIPLFLRSISYFIFNLRGLNMHRNRSWGMSDSWKK